MNRYRRIDYEKYIGCHHDDNDELVGGIAIPMVAMYDSEHMTEEEAKAMVAEAQPKETLLFGGVE